MPSKLHFLAKYSFFGQIISQLRTLIADIPAAERGLFPNYYLITQICKLSAEATLTGKLIIFTFLGERMTDEEVDLLVSGQEDQQGQINYEGMNKVTKTLTYSIHNKEPV